MFVHNQSINHKYLSMKRVLLHAKREGKNTDYIRYVTDYP
jgi:hypothetical protein